MEGLGSFLLFAVFFYLMMRFSCGAQIVHGHGAWCLRREKVHRSRVRHGSGA